VPFVYYLFLRSGAGSVSVRFDASRALLRWIRALGPRVLAFTHRLILLVRPLVIFLLAIFL
jgi:hypothetical protein